MIKLTTKTIAQASIIAAVYAVVTIAIAPLSYGVMQFRISEALTVLPIFTPVAVPGLFIGCILANLMSPVGMIDVLIGSVASLVAAYGTYKLREKRLIAILPPVIVNGILVGAELYYIYGVDYSLIACIMWVAFGEALSCYLLGYPLCRIMDKHKGIFK